MRILLLALVIGGAAGVGAAFARKALRAGVDDPDLIEKHINVPVYATISHSKNQDRIYKDMKSDKAKRAILAVEGAGRPGDREPEQPQDGAALRHDGREEQLHHDRGARPGGRQVLRQREPGGGARVATTSKVLLIDGDLRRGHLHEYLGVERENGLSEFISGEIPIGQALHRRRSRG